MSAMRWIGIGIGIGIVAAALSACASFGKGGRGAETPPIPVEAVLGQLEVALHDIDALTVWDGLATRHERLKSACEAISKDAPLNAERMCAGDTQGIATACGCTSSACTATASEACASAIERSQIACNYGKAVDGEIPACKFAAAHKVPKLKQADVTLQIVREHTSNVGLGVLLLKAGSTHAQTSGQTATFVLTPKPALELVENSAEDAEYQAALRAAEALRQDLLATVEASMKAMAMEEFTVPGHDKIKPSVLPEELKFTAEIVAKDGQTIGLEWKAASGVGGLAGGAGAVRTGGNKITLIFKR